MERYWVPTWVVECGVQREGCISMVKYADAQATVEALQRERDELREMTKVICGHCCEPMAIPSKAILQTHLSALQGLVRALPVVETELSDKARSVHITATIRINGEIYGLVDPLKALLEYRRTLPATPTERGENHSGDDTDMVQKGGGDGE